MENPVCQVCKKREAYKKIVSSLDGSFFLVCKKKKCITKLYKSFESHVPSQVSNEKEFVSYVKWDRLEHQGRSFAQMKSNSQIMDYLIMIGLAFMLSTVLYGLFNFFFL